MNSIIHPLKPSRTHEAHQNATLTPLNLSSTTPKKIQLTLPEHFSIKTSSKTPRNLKYPKKSNFFLEHNNVDVKEKCLLFQINQQKDAQSSK